MGFFDRLFRSSKNNPPAAAPSVMPAGAREYVFWLNDSLTGLAESTEELSKVLAVLLPISLEIQDSGETLPADESRRLANLLNRVLSIYREAKAYLPPRDFAWEWQDWQHNMYVDLLERHLPELNRLLTGLSNSDLLVTTDAFSQLAQLGTTTRELHSLVMERIIESLPPDQKVIAREEIRAINSRALARARALLGSRPDDCNPA